MKKTVYDTTKLAESIESFGSLAKVKQTMLENIVEISAAMIDEDSGYALRIQNNLMAIYHIINSIEEKGGDQ